jgi:hypothetical protein
MTGINIRELYSRVTSRPEILPGAMRLALMDAGIAVCRQSNLLKHTVYATLNLGTSSLAIPLPPDHELVRVDQVLFRDPADPLSQWVSLGEIASVYLERQSVHVESHPQDRPDAWGLRGTTLFFQAPADGTYPLRITYTWAPTRASQPEIFELPGEAEEAIIAYARWILLQDIDPKLAMSARRAFNDSLPDLRAMGESGESGTRSIFDFLPFEG